MARGRNADEKIRKRVDRGETIDDFYDAWHCIASVALIGIAWRVVKR
jgi:hypothetical protein